MICVHVDTVYSGHVENLGYWRQPLAAKGAVRSIWQRQITEVAVDKGQLKLRLSPQTPVEPAKLMAWVGRTKGASFSPDPRNWDEWHGPFAGGDLLFADLREGWLCEGLT